MIKDNYAWYDWNLGRIAMFLDHHSILASGIIRGFLNDFNFKYLRYGECRAFNYQKRSSPNERDAD